MVEFGDCESLGFVPCFIDMPFDATFTGLGVYLVLPPSQNIVLDSILFTGIKISRSKKISFILVREKLNAALKGI